MADTVPEKKPAAKKTAAKTATSAAAKKSSSTEKAPVKVVEKKAAVKKAAPAEKKPAPKKTAEKKAVSTPKIIKPIEAKGMAVSDEQRYRMIAEAAYYRAERSHFRSDPLRDWIEAEKAIDALLRGQ